MTREEKLTRQFYDWECRGRGWRVFSNPVYPEPPFVPFYGHFLSESMPADDGRKPTALSSWIQNISRSLTGRKNSPATLSDIPEAEPECLAREELTELVISLPENQSDDREIFSQFLANLTLLREPVTFEILGTPDAITPLLCVHSIDAGSIRRHFSAFFPGAVLTQKKDALAQAWDSENTPAIVEFGLAHEFMLPLNTSNHDLFVGLISAISELDQGESALFQVIFQPVAEPWADSIHRAVTDHEGGPFFANFPQLLPAARRKLSSPLYAVVVRLVAYSSDYSRAWEIVRDMAGPLTVLADPQGNELIPLHNNDYLFPCHEEDVLLRQSHRSGMLLNRDELLGLVHLPSAAVKTPKLVRERAYSKSAPALVRQSGILLGRNLHASMVTDVRLSQERRVCHAHILGATGTGKSTLLLSLIQQDIENGEGIAVLDPHGDLIEQILRIVPAQRIEDVVLFDPSDEEYPIGLNILLAHSELEKILLASDLSSVFKRLSSSWGDQMHSVLTNAILAFLESSKGGTLTDLRRFLLDTDFREKFLSTITDPEVVYYWRRGFPQLGGNKSIGPIITRLETFLGPKPIRYMVSQKENRLDFGEIMDTGKIFLAKLSQGQIGKENSYLLGSLLMSKFQQQAMSRQAKAKTERKRFWLYVDEFPNFMSPSIAEILTGARKYNLGLILAHQELRQLQADPDVAGAVLSNAGTRIVFRVGDADAKALAEGFSSFKAENLRKLGVGEAICRVERSDYDFNLTVPLPDAESNVEQDAAIRSQIVASSRAKYATPREDVLAALAKEFDAAIEAAPKPTRREKNSQPAAPENPAPAVPLPPPTPSENIAEIPKPEKKAAPATHTDMGRGGAQHQSIQQRLKAAAEELGFRATIEKQILESQGSVDLALEKEGFALACEITVTTTIDHEFGNVKKCLKAGFPIVAVISPKEDRLRQIEEAIRRGLESEASERVRYFLPDPFIVWLREIASTVSAPLVPASLPSETTRRGYKVRRHAAKLTEEERLAKEEVALKAIAESMKIKKSGK